MTKIDQDDDQITFEREKIGELFPATYFWLIRRFHLTSSG